jgi:hypothetical protein
MEEVLKLWTATFGGTNAIQQENAAKVVLTPDVLQRWFGDSMLQQPVYIPDLARATVVDLLRILDYPSEFVPIVSRRATSTASAVTVTGPIQVVDKSALNAQLAQSYVRELMDRARIA